MTNTYDIGDRRKLCAEIRDEDGALADPDELVFALRDPDGVNVAYTYGTDVELVKDSVGVYHVYWDCVTVGAHHWRYQASGVIAAGEESSFRVRTPAVDVATGGQLWRAGFAGTGTVS